MNIIMRLAILISFIPLFSLISLSLSYGRAPKPLTDEEKLEMLIEIRQKEVDEKCTGNYPTRREFMSCHMALQDKARELYYFGEYREGGEIFWDMMKSYPKARVDNVQEHDIQVLRGTISTFTRIIEEQWKSNKDFDEIEKAMFTIIDPLERFFGYEYGILNKVYKQLALYAEEAGYEDSAQEYSELAELTD